MDQSVLPIGLVLSQTAKQTTRSFEDALVSAGGSLAMWLVLQALVAEGPILQSDLARRVGVQGSTLTHHLNGFETRGLILRTRVSTDRRNHLVTLTQAGQEKYSSLRSSAHRYDQALQEAMTLQEMVLLRAILARLAKAAQTHDARQG
jgi:MarR family transcriptional regulator, transcriptional regulator for hemolysin